MPLLRYVRHLTGDDQLAQDVVQETLLRAWTNPQILEEEVAGARAWLYTVARNIVIDHSRSARVRRECDWERAPKGGHADPTESALTSWLVADALTQLTPDHRNVLVRAYYMGQSVAELAIMMDVPPGTIRSRLHYGLRALRFALQERGVTGP